jgi:aldose 1-epimerase
LHPGIVGKGGRACRRHAGFCLETQRFPDAVNRPEFPSTILRPGQEYRSRTVYRFSTDR